MVSYSYSNSPELQTVAIGFNLLQRRRWRPDLFQTVAICCRTRLGWRVIPSAGTERRRSAAVSNGRRKKQQRGSGRPHFPTHRSHCPRFLALLHQRSGGTQGRFAQVIVAATNFWLSALPYIVSVTFS